MSRRTPVTAGSGRQRGGSALQLGDSLASLGVTPWPSGATSRETSRSRADLKRRHRSATSATAVARGPRLTTFRGKPMREGAQMENGCNRWYRPTRPTGYKCGVLAGPGGQIESRRQLAQPGRVADPGTPLVLFSTSSKTTNAVTVQRTSRQLRRVQKDDFFCRGVGTKPRPGGSAEVDERVPIQRGHRGREWRWSQAPEKQGCPSRTSAD